MPPTKKFKSTLANCWTNPESSTFASIPPPPPEPSTFASILPPSPEPSTSASIPPSSTATSSTSPDPENPESNSNKRRRVGLSYIWEWVFHGGQCQQQRYRHGVSE